MLWATFAMSKCLYYDKIIVNINSLTFCNFIKNKTISFEVIRNMYLDIYWNSIIVRGCSIHITISSLSKTRDGLIKLVQISECLRDKDYYINKINEKADFIWLVMLS